MQNNKDVAITYSDKVIQTETAVELLCKALYKLLKK